MTRVLTAEEFAELSPYQKGYIVYMAGARDDQPHVPETYEPTDEDRVEYERGQHKAVLDAIDSEE